MPREWPKKWQKDKKKKRKENTEDEYDIKLCFSHFKGLQLYLDNLEKKKKKTKKPTDSLDSQSFWCRRSRVDLRRCISTKYPCPRPHFEKLSCDVIIYYKRYIVFIPVSGTELLKPLEFLVMKTTKVSLVVLMRWLLDSTKGWGLIASGANHVIRGMELLGQPLSSWRGERPEVELSRPWPVISSIMPV